MYLAPTISLLDKCLNPRRRTTFVDDAFNLGFSNEYVLGGRDKEEETGDEQ